MSSVNWISIKNEYINTNISYRKLAEKYNVSFATLQTKAKKECWKNERDKQYDKTMTKIRQKTETVIVKKEVNRIERLTNATDRLLEIAELAIKQLDKHNVINSIKVKEDAYIDEKRVETTTENKTITTQIGLYKTNELKQIASTLKDIKDIQTAVSDSNTADTPKVVDDIG